mmetsp:Transcript_34653/g.78361  ORF Transcript_34653/g.78361 Transcript_34653/m.78361 type:complete len:499 (+) Transcript_34653:133-1629(+)
MIHYKKGCAGLWIVLHFAGTSWSSGIIPGLISACIGLAISQVSDLDATISDEDRFIDNPYPFQLFAYMVGFLMVFRTNFAYQRYWEALDAVQRMGAKWFDGACMSIAFDAPGAGDASMPYLAGRDHPERQRQLKDVGHSHTEFFFQVAHLFSLLHGLALQHLRCDPDLTNLEAHENLHTPFVPPPVPSIIAHKSSGGLAAFSEGNVRSQLQLRKLKILGALAPEELVLLEENTQNSQVPTLARVAMVQSWIMRRLISRQKYEPMGEMGKTSPPILSRLYQVISDGHLGFSQASKVSDTPFPFPYHNLIRIFLWMYALSVPFVINSKVLHILARFIMNFLAVWAYFALCEVGDNLEDPFLPYDPNELPLQAIQHAFNARLLSLNRVPTWIPECKMDDKEELTPEKKVGQVSEASPPSGPSPEKTNSGSGGAGGSVNGSLSTYSAVPASGPGKKPEVESSFSPDQGKPFSWADYYQQRLDTAGKVIGNGVCDSPVLCKSC